MRRGDTGVVGDVVVRAGGAAGIAGPAVFTSAWIVSSLRQTGHSAADLQISGGSAGQDSGDGRLAATRGWSCQAGMVAM
jgi:hypothetical protein